MEPFFIALIIAVSIFTITSTVVCICRKRKQKRFQGEVFSAPAETTSTTHTAPEGYVVTQIPISSSATVHQTQIDITTPYPPQGVQPYGTIYPPMPTTGNMNPPSYDMTTTAADSGQPNTSKY